MRTLIFTLLSSTMLIACQPAEQAKTEPTTEPTTEATETAQSESEKLNAWFDEKYKEELEFSPISKTFLGIKDEDYGKVDDLSVEAEAKQLEWRKATLAEMESKFDYNKLDANTKISYDLWAYQTARSEAAAKYPYHGYAFDQMNGLQGFVPMFLMQFHKVETESDMQDYIARISESARGLNQVLERGKLAAEKGIVAPDFAHEGVIEQSEKVLVGAPFDDSEQDSDLLADAKRKAAALVESETITQERADELVAEAEAAYAGAFKTAFEDIIAYHKEVLPTLGEPKGIWSLPDGEAYYNERLAYSTTTDLTADEIHQIGLDEVARIRGEMEAIKEKVGFEGDLQEFFEFVRTDSQFFYPDTDEGRQAYIDDATAAIDNIKSQLPDFFGILPKADLEVKRVEAFREQDGAAQHYFPGTPDGSRPGIYYAHLSDMTAMPKNQLEVIAYHEGLPGHHMQISIAQELEGVPQFRTQASFTAYIEGWALYTELLATEMGAYEDPYSDFGRLTTEMWRAVRLVVDTGIHAKQWKEDETIAYFMANTPEPEASARAEVQRYFVLPGQATSYKIGMLKIIELRKKAEEALGDKFDIRGFHDTVLGGGAVPLAVLEKQVDNWIAAKQA